MELSVLQDLWLENNRKLDESIQLNRTILDQLLRSKSKRRLTWIKAEAIVEIILPPIILIGFLYGYFVLPVNAGLTVQFYIGAIIFGLGFTLIYIGSVWYYWLLSKIDFTQKILGIKTTLLMVEAFKLKLTRVRYLLMPFAITGIFMMLGISFSHVTFYTIVPLILIVCVFAGSLYVTFKFTVVERFRKLKLEILELEKLMKEE